MKSITVGKKDWHIISTFLEVKFRTGFAAEMWGLHNSKTERFQKLELSQKALGEYNCIFGKRLWDDPHCCTAYTQAGSLEKEAPEEHMLLFCPYSGSVSAGRNDGCSTFGVTTKKVIGSIGGFNSQRLARVDGAGTWIPVL
ncbi:hypothetical protein CMV_021818 [Castanea mollissima]|uniref:Uncharacterized protein n=1 Tax=Castanea mollissima TaxID=60419 RepID=A0A8J4VK92_9ROSI|nr:hypothetical protein CMV_021818 [Castanea mollissima]